VACVAPAARADAILVGAPVFNGFSAWDSQGGIPPSGTVFDFADEFALASAQNVTKIQVSLFGATGVTPASFTFALVDSLASLSPLASAIFTAPSDGTITQYELTVNSVLAAGTYFIRLTTGGFFGWPVADATQFVTTAGTIADGIWELNTNVGTWTFLSSGGGTSAFLPHPGVFSVLGPSAGGNGTAPEPESALLFMLGLIGVVAAHHKRAP
jgi:hypothetical protein